MATGCPFATRRADETGLGVIPSVPRIAKATSSFVKAQLRS
jgi:hypothetical protein